MIDALVLLAARGIIMGPQEDEASFMRRSQLPAYPRQDGHKTCKAIFSVSPDWINVLFSNKGLQLWQGGCTLIDEEGVEVRLRKGYETKKKLFGIYSLDEIVAHEAVHAMRQGFDEPQFEEILAYKTAKTGFRRYFGPLFRTPGESLFFLGALFVFVGATLVIPLGASFSFLGGVLGAFVVRLYRDQCRFSRAYQRLGEPLGAMLWLTDKEIILFSKWSRQEIVEWMEKEKVHNLRIKQLSDWLKSSTLTR